MSKVRVDRIATLDDVDEVTVRRIVDALKENDGNLVEAEAEIIDLKSQIDTLTNVINDLNQRVTALENA